MQRMNHVLNVTVEPELFAEVDEYRFANKKASRNEAIRELIRCGLSAHRQAQAMCDPNRPRPDLIRKVAEE